MTEQEEFEFRRRLELEQAGTRRGGNAPLAFAKGTTSTLSKVLGAPVDLATAALGTIGYETGLLKQPLSLENSVGGSASIRRGLRRLGVGSYDNINEIAPEDRPFAVAGEAFMGSALPGAAAMRVAQASRAAPALVDPVTRMIQQAPGRFAAAEVGMSTGAAGGAAAAEQIAPGNPLARAAGEITGGFLNPSALASRGVGVARDNVERLAATLTPSGRERRAAGIVQDVVSQTGESRQALINALRQSDDFNLGLTSGQRTASPALLAIEARLANASPQFSASVENRVPQAFGRLQQAGEDVIRTGDPNQLRAAAQARLGQTQGLARTRAMLADQQAANARGQVGNVSRADMSDASVQARDALEAALSSARGQERQLWGQVPRDLPAQPANVLAARQGIRDELLPNEALPQPVETFTGGLARQADTPIETGLLSASGAPITRPGQAEASSGELLRLRNRALTEARGARARGDFQLERQMNQIAQGALDDLSALQNASIDPARQFSFNLNERFTRGAGGRTLATDRTGAPRVAPEQTLERAFGGGGTGGGVRMRQLSEAAEFGGQGAEMLTAQDRFLRGAVQSAIDQNTGRVNADRLAAFVRQNEETLGRFPQLRSQLGNAETAERELLRVSAITSKAERNAAKTLFAQIAGNENPSNVVTQVLRGANPSAQYESLIRSASNAGPEAVAGLRAATLESVFKQATRPDGTVDFARLNQALSAPAGYRQGAPSLLQTMTANGVLDRAGAERLQAITSRADILRRASGTKSDLDKLVGEPDMLSNFLQRVVGANIGGALGQGTGAPLVAAGAGSRLAQSFFDKMPAAKVQAVLIEAANNPDLMRKLLEKPTNVQQAREIQRQLNGFLVNAGIVAAGENEERRRPLQRSVEAYAN
jgi:hypothetical protein